MIYLRVRIGLKVGDFMYSIIMDLLYFFGVPYSDSTSLGSFVFWFVGVLLGMEFVLFIFDGIFYTVRQINRGIR